MLSKRLNASEYLPVSTNSSICSSQDLILNIHTELPSLASFALSVGVENRKRGDLEGGVGESSRSVKVLTAADESGALLNG